MNGEYMSGGSPHKHGLGIDLVEIPRIESSLKRFNFLTRCFGEHEIEEYKSRGSKASYIAANFCAKEAFSKAIGTGIRGFDLREVELLRDSMGKPYIAFSGRAAEMVKRLGFEFEVSVSHTKHYAVAVVEAYYIEKETER